MGVKIMKTTTYNRRIVGAYNLGSTQGYAAGLCVGALCWLGYEWLKSVVEDDSKKTATKQPAAE